MNKAWTYTECRNVHSSLSLYSVIGLAGLIRRSQVVQFYNNHCGLVIFILSPPPGGGVLLQNTYTNLRSGVIIIVIFFAFLAREGKK